MENLGCVTFRETELLIDPATASQTELAARRARRRPRARPHVVRRPRHDGVVGGDLAQRGVRHVHGDALHRPLPARVEEVGALQPRARLGVHDRRPALDAPDRVRGRLAERVPWRCSTCSPTRRAARCSGCSSSTSGEDTFRDGIRRYLAEHAYANTVTKDLWAALEAASGEPVGEIMDTWILQGGHPLVSVGGDVDLPEPFAYAGRDGRSAIGSTVAGAGPGAAARRRPRERHLLEEPSGSISRRRRAPSSTPAATASTARATRPEHLAADRRRPRGPRRARARRAVHRHLGGDPRRPVRTSPTSSRSARGSRTWTSPSAFDVVATSASLRGPRSSTTTATARCPARSGRCGARSSHGSGGSRDGEDERRRQELRADGRSASSARRARTRRSSPRPSSRFDAGEVERRPRRRDRRDHDRARAVRATSPRAATARPAPRPRRTSSATSSRPPSRLNRPSSSRSSSGPSPR